MAELSAGGVALSESDYESLKIFAGGLTRSTSADDLKDYFGRFGEVTEAEIVGDKVTGRSRGFGFVSFGSREAVRTVLRQSHRVDGVVIDVKLAVRREKSRLLAPQYDETKRIFVGGISEKISESYFRDYFARYGPISSYNYLMDRATNRPRGYGFVIYERMEDAEKSVGPHASLGRNCEAKFAQPKANDRAEATVEDFDYSAYYYAQANLLYSQYLSQVYSNQPSSHSDTNLNTNVDTNSIDNVNAKSVQNVRYRSASRSRSRARHGHRSRSHTRRGHRSRSRGNHRSRRSTSRRSRRSSLRRGDGSESGRVRRRDYRSSSRSRRRSPSYNKRHGK